MSTLFNVIKALDCCCPPYIPAENASFAESSEITVNLVWIFLRPCSKPKGYFMSYEFPRTAPDVECEAVDTWIRVTRVCCTVSSVLRTQFIVELFYGANGRWVLNKQWTFMVATTGFSSPHLVNSYEFPVDCNQSYPQTLFAAALKLEVDSAGVKANYGSAPMLTGQLCATKCYRNCTVTIFWYGEIFVYDDFFPYTYSVRTEFPFLPCGQNPRVFSLGIGYVRFPYTDVNGFVVPQDLLINPFAFLPGLHFSFTGTRCSPQITS